jgi:Holliday junction resolvase
MAGNKKESSIQEDIIEYLKSIGAYVVKVHVSSYQSQGTPDILCCYKGLFLAFELKVPGETASELQEYRIEQIQRAKGHAYVADSIEKVKEVLYDIDRIQWYGKPL